MGTLTNLLKPSVSGSDWLLVLPEEREIGCRAHASQLLRMAETAAPPLQQEYRDAAARWTGIAAAIKAER